MPKSDQPLQQGNTHRNVDMKNVQEHDFCSKIDQIMSMSNMPK